MDRIIKKVSIICIFLTIFNFYKPIESNASFGGKLLEPVVNLCTFVVDGLNDVLNYATIGQEVSVKRIDPSATKKTVWTWIAGIAAGAAVLAGAIALVAFGVVTGGLGLLVVAPLAAGGIAAYCAYNADAWPEVYDLPLYSITAENIFKNKIALFDVDFFNPMGYKTTDDQGNEVYMQDLEIFGGTVPVKSSASILQKTIASWYKTLRDISIVALLSILVYIGIRILISSTSNDKAKYKQMIIDWVVAMCLLFVMHYIMSFSNILVKKITEMVKSTTENEVVVCIPCEESKYKETIKEVLGIDDAQYDKLTQNTDADGNKLLAWKTDFMGKARLELQLNRDNNAKYAGYTVLYVAMAFMTVFFAFTYLKRLIYMAFLTLIAPLVALTYPIDKLNDGKAQAFDSWIKEYIFNLLIQPLHLLLYTILISSAFELATNNIIYAVVALGFMIPSEKLMRRFFGFEKAHTPGLLAGPAGAAMMMSGMNKLLSKGPRGGKDGVGKSGVPSSEKDNTKVRTKDDFDPDAVNANKIDANTKNNKPKMMNNDDEEKTDLQKMTDADYENNWLSADNNELQTLEANSRDAYGDGEGMKYTDDEMEGILRDSGYSDDEIAEYMKDYNKDYNSDKSAEIDINSQGEKLIDTNQNNRENVNNKPKGSLRKAIGRSARYYGKGMAKKVKNASVGRRAVKMVGGAALGATAGTIGLAAGIVSGDPSKAFQYTAAGAVGGYKLGSRIPNDITNMANDVKNTISVPGTGKIFKENYYGKDEYKERQIQQDIKQKQNDLELRWKLEDKLKSKDAADKYMKEALPEVTRYGDFDNKTIVAMAQMEAEGIKRNETIAAALISERDLAGKDSNNLGDKAATEFEKTMKRKGRERGLDGDNLDKFVDKSVGNVKKLDKLRYK